MVAAVQVAMAVDDFLREACEDNAELIGDGYPLEFAQKVMAVTSSGLGEAVPLHYRREFAETYAQYYTQERRRQQVLGRRRWQ